MLLAGSLVLVCLAVPALAHTEFESSTPADGEVVDEPVSEIAISFTLPVTVVGNGFEVLDPQGNIIEPEVETDDDTVFTLILDESLAGGEVGVRYEVAAKDGHVLAGGFVFTVTTPVETDAVGTTTTTANVTTSSHITPTTSITTTTISVPAGGEEGSMAPLLIGLGVVVVGGAGLYAGIRSRA